MMWSLDLDDFSGRACNQGRFPLTTVMKHNLKDQRVDDGKARWKHRRNSSPELHNSLILSVLIFMNVLNSFLFK